ncbi:MAG: TMEM165/GDT1 family protein [Candidatus Levybacteria bacterium]|nr:TMEM165/GDT1 family protein [Candidatus Levybacteria bacterium]
MKLFISTALLIFLAELGDKTQLATMTLSAKEKSPLTIFVSALFGFALATLLAVAVGSLLNKIIPIEIIEKVAAIAFISIGILMLLGKI